jgi:hypothetical protein
MRSKAHILPFPKAGKKDEGPRRKARPPRTTDTIKYFSRNQIKLLRRTAREQAELDTQFGACIAWDHFRVLSFDIDAACS